MLSDGIGPLWAAVLGSVECPQTSGSATPWACTISLTTGKNGNSKPDLEGKNGDLMRVYGGLMELNGIYPLFI